MIIMIIKLHFKKHCWLTYRKWNIAKCLRVQKETKWDDKHKRSTESLTTYILQKIKNIADKNIEEYLRLFVFILFFRVDNI